MQVSFAQENQLDTLIKKFQRYRIKSLQEKVYAHLDREFYLTGETLFFKAYSVDGSFHKPLTISSVAYVEIFDKTNIPVLQAKVELNHGSGSGSFFLPASLRSGNYKFRLYTNWMKNFSHEFYFNQIFTIINPFLNPELSHPKTANSYTAIFFPEGGNLVSGVQSKIGFKITDAAGKGKFCKGFVLNNQHDTITSFIPAKFGIGHFLFTPFDNEQYKVILKDEQGRISNHPFPEIHKSGYVMHLKDSGQFLKINIATKSTQDSYAYLFVHARQIIALAELQILRGNKATFIIKKSDLPEGISHLTVLNDQLNPMCERLYFTYPKKALEIDLVSNQAVYNPRKKVVISLQTNNDQKTPSTANLSMAVFKMDSLSTNQPIGIFHYLWLASDLRGAIESPGYYFNRTEPGVAESMDNLMLTHGWRRFDWSNILEKEKDFEYLPEPNGHIVNGLVTNGQETQRGVLTYLASPGNIIRTYGSRSNDQGEVRYEIRDFFGPKQIILQTHTDSSRHYQIMVQNPFSSLFSSEQVPELRISSENEKSLLARSIAMQVQDLYYYNQYGNRIINPGIDSSAFYGNPDATYYLDDYTRFQVMEEVMREYVSEVFVRKRKDGFHFIMLDGVQGGVLTGDPMILLDGVPVFDVDDIMKLDPLQVKKIDIVKREYYLGQAVFSGILSYSTYQGNLGGLKLNPRSTSLNYDGLQLKREFYNPQYNNDMQRASRLPDQRYLLYWNPDITTNEGGKQQVEFFTSDVEGNYLVVVEGLNSQGFSGSKSYTFSVKHPDSQ